MFSTYSLKPRLQEWLHPWAQMLVNRGITANQVTLLAAAVSLALGVLLTLFSSVTWLFWLLPLWWGARLVLNTLDGLMARDFMQESAKGGYLNEMGDLLSDAALYLPFAFIVPWGGALAIAVFIWLAAMTEVIGLLGQIHGFHGRRYDGPLGKSDRAIAFVVLAIWYAWAGSLNALAGVVVWLLVLAAAYTCWIRMQNGLKA